MPAESSKAISFTLRSQPTPPAGGFKYSFPANCILQSTSRILHLAGGLLGLTFGLGLCITGHLTGGLFNGTLHLMRGTFDSVLIHMLLPQRCWGFKYALRTLVPAGNHRRGGAP